MDTISDVTVTELKDSKYIKQKRMNYVQNGEKKTWDLLQVHDSVCILIFNKSRNVFIFVRQFRPAVYICNCELTTKDSTTIIDSEKYPGSLGVTLELCAGIVDKEKPLETIAQEEVLEECGYQVPLENIRKVTSYRAGVGTSGALQTLYYVEVTDEMKIGKGGGIDQELIEIVEIPVSDGKNLVMDETLLRPVGMMFAVTWFYDNIWKKET